MRETFRELKGFRAEKLNILHNATDIIEEYYSQDMRMTLRQVYYRLVGNGIISSGDSSYEKVKDVVKEGRYAGVIDWDAIEDRLRKPYLPYYNSSPSEAIQSALDYYRIDRQKGQDTYVEVWVEKDALSGVLKPITEKYHVTLMVNRGFGSSTMIYDAVNRFKEHIVQKRRVEIIYLGDHDPSGVYMVADVFTRINEMMPHFKTLWDIIQIAITPRQAKVLNLPSFKAKPKAQKYKEFVYQYGNECWEVDAIEPRQLNEMLISEIESRIDMNLFNQMLEKEKEDKKTLEGFIKKENGK